MASTRSASAASRRVKQPDPQPISITRTTIEPITRVVADRIKDNKPPGWRTVCRDYRKWLAAGRDIRAIILRHAERGRPGTRLAPEVKTIPTPSMTLNEGKLGTKRKIVCFSGMLLMFCRFAPLYAKGSMGLR